LVQAACHKLGQGDRVRSLHELNKSRSKQYPNVDQSLSTWKPYECCKENLNKFHANNILKKGKIDLQEMIDWPNEAPR
jgi:hypothetical protein